MNYKKFAKLLKRADGKDYANERINIILSKINDIEEFYKAIDKEIEELGQREYPDNFKEDVEYHLRWRQYDQNYIKQEIIEFLYWKVVTAADKLLGIKGMQDLKNELRQSLMREIRFFFHHLKKVYDSQKMLEFRNKLLSQPEKIDEIAKQLVEKVKTKGSDFPIEESRVY